MTMLYQIFKKNSKLKRIKNNKLEIIKINLINNNKYLKNKYIHLIKIYKENKLLAGNKMIKLNRKKKII